MSEIIRLEKISQYAEFVVSRKNTEPPADCLKILIEYIKELNEATFEHNRKHVVIEKLLTACEITKHQLSVSKTVETETRTPDYVTSFTKKEKLKTCDEDDVSYTWETHCETVSFKDVVGGAEAINTIQESLIMPFKYRILFEKSNAKPWRTLLLYGPPGQFPLFRFVFFLFLPFLALYFFYERLILMFPGTGKSLIARATANEVNFSYFKASGAELTSKWVGESEKLLRSLFVTARKKSPAIIFLDEIDSIGSSRGADKTMADQRLTNQLLIELDNNYNDDVHIIVIAATNLPWVLDVAVLRRFPKRIYLGLPDADGRENIIRLTNKKNSLSEDQIRYIVEKSSGLSGSDIVSVMNDIYIESIRILQRCECFYTYHTSDSDGTRHTKVEIFQSQDADRPDSCTITNSSLESIIAQFSEENIVIPSVEIEYIRSTLENIKPSANMDYMKQYESFMTV